MQVFRKIPRPSSCERPVNSPLHLVQLLEIQKRIASGTHSSVSSLLFTTHCCWQWRNEQICNK
jgi:hypothetical protein